MGPLIKLRLVSHTLMAYVLTWNIIEECGAQNVSEPPPSSEPQYREGSVMLYFDTTLFVYHDGIPGRVCNDGWDLNDANVVCRELGYPKGAEFTHFRGISRDIPVNDPTWISDVSCKGSERYLADCDNDGWYDHVDCGTSDTRFHVTVRCNKPDYLYPRLYNGTTWYEGRVHVWDGQNWKEVCSENFGEDEAKTVCKQLGFPDIEKVYDYNKFGGQQYGFPFQHSFDCNGTEEGLSSCNLHHSPCVNTFTYASISCLPGEGHSTAPSTTVIATTTIIFILLS